MVFLFFYILANAHPNFHCIISAMAVLNGKIIKVLGIVVRKNSFATITITQQGNFLFWQWSPEIRNHHSRETCPTNSGEFLNQRIHYRLAVNIFRNFNKKIGIRRSQYFYWTTESCSKRQRKEELIPDLSSALKSPKIKSTSLIAASLAVRMHFFTWPSSF